MQIQIHDCLIKKEFENIFFNQEYDIRDNKLSNDDNKPRFHKFELFADKSRIPKVFSFDIFSNINIYD